MRTKSQPTIRAKVAFAADERGEGVAYARLSSAAGSHVLRVGFRAVLLAGLGAREVSYAALTAVAGALRARGVSNLVVEVGDSELVRDVTEHRNVPPPLTLPYIRLGCTLNRFEKYTLVTAPEDADLYSRARAEVALHLAA